jgi:hypothetical protein
MEIVAFVSNIAELINLLKIVLGRLSVARIGIAHCPPCQAPI